MTFITHIFFTPLASHHYDAVSNITDINNAAGTLSNGLGGKYSNRYNYDNLYRLVYSEGTWDGVHFLNYKTSMRYHRNGRIESKSMYADIFTQSPAATSNSTVHYANDYSYNTTQPNTVSSISNSTQQMFEWDPKGNLVFHHNENTQSHRMFCWDEQNRLQGVVDKKYLSYYQYDANGDRTFKLTGKGDLQNISGTWQYYYLLENATLYASPYLVATDKGYTKHYYAESERIASKIGGGGLTEFGHPLLRNKSFVKKMEANSTMMDKVLVGCLNAKYYEVKPVLQHLYDWQDSVQPEDNCYWYHPDHLGSSSWITHTYGHTVQHLHYLPWGEDFINQKLSGFDGVRYTFSAKEKDAETGYSYFGARYYSSDLSIWLSVDPMSDMFPSVSPFIYCNNNPIRLTDPNGESPISLGAKFAAKKATKAVAKALIKNLVTDRLSAYASKKWAQQLLSDALDMVGVLSGQSWWE